MTEIAFYHCTRTPPDVALPKLLERALAAGERVVVRCASAERVTALDDALWACKEPFWLPHGSGEDPDLQPIWLTDRDENPNGARLLFVMDGATARASDFARVLDLFDGNDSAQLERARERWRAAKDADHMLVYYQQGGRGWETKD